MHLHRFLRYHSSRIAARPRSSQMGTGQGRRCQKSRQYERETVLGRFKTGLNDDKDNIREYLERWRWLDNGLGKGYGYKKFTAKHEEGQAPCCKVCEDIRWCKWDNEEAARTQSLSPVEPKETVERNSDGGSDTGSEVYETADGAQSSPQCDDSQ